MRIWSKVLAAGIMTLGLLTGTANASTIDEVIGASHKLFKDNQSICSGTIVNSPVKSKQIFVTSAHCIIDIDDTKTPLLQKIDKAQKSDYTIKYVVYNEELDPTLERVFHLKLFNYMISPEADLAFLEFVDPTIKLPAVDLATDEEAKAIKVGEDVAVVGFPLGYDVTLTKGQFSGKQKANRAPIDSIVFRFTAPATYGNSGGGLYSINNGDYKLIGVVSFLLDGTLGKGVPMGFMNFAIPVTQVNAGLAYIDIDMPNGVTLR